MTQPIETIPVRVVSLARCPDCGAIAQVIQRHGKPALAPGACRHAVSAGADSVTFARDAE